MSPSSPIIGLCWRDITESTSFLPRGICFLDFIVGFAVAVAEFGRARPDGVDGRALAEGRICVPEAVTSKTSPPLRAARGAELGRCLRPLPWDFFCALEPTAERKSGRNITFTESLLINISATL